MSEAALPAPLVPSDVDLRGYEFMPLYGARLRESDFNSLATDSEYRAAHNLWWSAWQQVPAASLPADDITLCKLADLHRDQAQWQKVKARAMHGFVLCSDGRWYHKELSGLAIEAFESRRMAQAKGKAGASKRWGKPGHQKYEAQASLLDAQASESDASAKPPDSTSNAPAIEKHSTGEDRKGKKSTSAEPDVLPGFARFWEAWPRGERKTAKADCLRKWRSKGLEVRADAIVAHVQAMKSTDSWQRGFVPMPLTYLNQERYEAEAPAGADAEGAVI